jgi:hypothetical protein
MFPRNVAVGSPQDSGGLMSETGVPHKVIPHSYVLIGPPEVPLAGEIQSDTIRSPSGWRGL